MYEFHPLANQLAMMADEEFEALKSDIAEFGQQEPIVLYEGKILDGRNRYRACQELGVSPTTTEFTGSRERAVALSMSMNLMRRNLSKSQKAMTIARSGLVSEPNGDPEDGKESIRSAAKRYGVNHMTIYKAFYVLANDKSLANEVFKGTISVGKAESIIRERARKRLTVQIQSNPEPTISTQMIATDQKTKRNQQLGQTLVPSEVLLGELVSFFNDFRLSQLQVLKDDQKQRVLNHLTQARNALRESYS